MANPYRRLVKEAWVLLAPERFDERDFLTMVKDLVAERDDLAEMCSDLMVAYERLAEMYDELCDDERGDGVFTR